MSFAAALLLRPVVFVEVYVLWVLPLAYLLRRLRRRLSVVRELLDHRPQVPDDILARPDIVVLVPDPAPHVVDRLRLRLNLPVPEHIQQHACAERESEDTLATPSPCL